MNIVINNRILSIIKVAATLDKAVMWADVLAPNDDFTVVDENTETFAGYNLHKLRSILANSTDTEINLSLSRSELISHIIGTARNMPVDNSSKEWLEANAQKPTPQPVKKAPKTSSATKSSTEIARPKAGTTTGKVWEILDNIGEENCVDGVPDRALAIQLCESQGINKATAATQYSKYKRFVLAAK